MHKEGLFAHFHGATVKRYQSLINTFGTLENAWRENKHAFKQLGWKDEIIDAFFLFKESVDEHSLEKNLEQKEIQLICTSSPQYPPQLKDLYDPPFCLFVRGKLPSFDPSVVIVGPRKCSPYAKSILPNFIDELCQLDIPIISGLAYGIDALAHSRCIKQGGITVAVLPGGIDPQSIQPRQHEQLAEHIISSGGAIISEFPPGTEVFAHSFPRRNRIVAALSPLTLVVEAGKKSGSLITAQVATDLHREVAAIPQDIRSSNSEGAHRLIQQGAHLIHAPEDIFSLLGIQLPKESPTQKKSSPQHPDQLALYDLIPKHSPLHIDEIRRLYTGDKSQVATLVSLLELSGYIKHQGGMYYGRTG